MNKPITIRAQNEVRVGPRFGQDGQSTLGYSMTYVVIKILVAPRGGASGPPMPVSATDDRPPNKSLCN